MVKGDGFWRMQGSRDLRAVRSARTASDGERTRDELFAKAMITERETSDDRRADASARRLWTRVLRSSDVCGRHVRMFPHPSSELCGVPGWWTPAEDIHQYLGQMPLSSLCGLELAAPFTSVDYIRRSAKIMRQRSMFNLSQEKAASLWQHWQQGRSSRWDLCAAIHVQIE